MEILPPVRIRHVGALVVRCGRNNHLLDVLPGQVLLAEALLLLSLGLVKLEEENPNEEVEEEERSDKDEYHEERHCPQAVLKSRAQVQVRYVQGLIHYVGPGFKTGNHVEGDHGLGHIIKVEIPARPLAQLK